MEDRVNERAPDPGDQRVIDESLEYARRMMKDIRSSHGWDHVLRVVSLAGRIADTAGADPVIVKVAAILHDIAREAEDRGGGEACHAREGSRMALDFLLGMGWDRGKAEHAARCIRAHRFRGDGAPETIEAKVLFDADKLDSIGAIGIGRAFLFSGEIGARLHNGSADPATTNAYTREDTAYREFIVKLQYVKDRMLTAEGRRLARERHLFMMEFFSRLDAEASGKA